MYRAGPRFSSAENMDDLFTYKELSMACIQGPNTQSCKYSLSEM